MTEEPTVSRQEEERLAGLTPSQMKALTALLSGATQTEAAALAGVSRQHLAHWIHDDLIFSVNLKREKLALMRTARASIATGTLEAVNFLRSTLADADADLNQKLKAASLLLNSSGLDQAPSPWPALNDVELLVASELDDIVKHRSTTRREIEAVEAERAYLDNHDPTVLAQLEERQARLMREIDRTRGKLKKLENRRRQTERQKAQATQLQIALREMELEYRHTEAAVVEMRLLENGARDLQVSAHGLRVVGNHESHLVSWLRQQREMDG